MTRVVAMGGGHGLAATLRAVRRYAGEICAIVSVADDGGSSGRLRHDYGVPPPGDLRRCLVALAGEQSVWTEAFEHRFEAGELEGHALGNLVIAGLAASTGDFERALAECGRLLATTGTVVPATREAVVLKAVVRSPETEAPSVVEGQVAVKSVAGIAGVSLVPPDPEPPAAALEALAGADQVVLGPGSLYTSVLAAAAVPALREALAKTPATRVYVCNLRPQEPETAGYDVAAHVAALEAHGVSVDVVLCDSGSTMALGDLTAEYVRRPLARPGGSGHDPALLAEALADLVG